MQQWLQSIALLCIVLPCIALAFIALPCIGLPCITLTFIALHCIDLPCIALPCIALQYNSQCKLDEPLSNMIMFKT